MTGPREPLADPPAAWPAKWWWGTNRPDGPYYAGRTHVVHPDQPTEGLCGLPVDEVWRLRPSQPPHLCDSFPINFACYCW